MYLETERMTVRDFAMDDLEDLQAILGDEETMAYSEPTYTRERTAEFLRQFCVEKKGAVAAVLKATGRVIGSLGLEPTGHCEDLPEDWRGREIGYVLAKDRWGQGLMPEAVRAVIAECFGAQDYDFLTCGHFLRNRQSRRVIEKCGFSYWKDILFRTRMGTEEPVRLYLLKNTRKGDIHV